MRPLVLICLIGSSVASISAQTWQRHNLSVTLGAGLPRGEAKPVLRNAFGAGVTYHYRFLPWFAAEGGYKSLIGAAGVNDYVDTFFGPLRIRDFQHFLPFGGRVILPLANDRIQVYGGGGGAYLRYSERIQQPFNNSNFRVRCPYCGSRNGFGYYATSGANVAIDSQKHFRLGVSVDVFRGATSGDRIGAVPGIETADRWLNIFASLGFSF
jgi:hypothetical protein